MEAKNDDKTVRYHRTNANEKTDDYGFIFVTPLFKNSSEFCLPMPKIWTNIIRFCPSSHATRIWARHF